MSVEFVGIELELRGEESVKASLESLDSLIHSLQGRKKIDLGMQQLKKDIAAAEGKLREFKRLQEEAGGKGKSAFADMGVKKTRQEIEEMNAALKLSRITVQSAGKTFQQTFNSISSRIAHAGSAMQSLGNAMTRFANPFTRLATGLLYGAGYKLLNTFTEGFSGAFERYDTMQNYAKSLKALGLNADKTFKVFASQEKAMTAIENLNESVLGLPTGLDEIVAAQKVYAGATNEMEKSTKLAIAANNTFLASSTNAREQRFIQRYLTSLASGAELTTTQWQSMGRIAPLALNAVAEELGVTSQELRQGKVAGQEFLDAFIKVGTNGKIQAAANVMKTTWEGLSANIQNATKRMGEGLLKSLDEVFIAYNGRNLVQNLLGFDAEGNEVGGGIKHWINGISDAAQNWVKSHPEKIIEFFDTLKSIDWKSLAKGFAEGIGSILKALQLLAKIADGKDLSWISRMAIKMSLWGKIFTILGGVLKGLRHPLALIATIASRAGKGGLIGKLLTSMFGAKGLGDAATQAKKIPTVATTFKSAFSALEGLMKVAGATILVSGAGFVAFKSAKSILKDLKEMTDLVNGGGWDNVGYVGSGVIVAIGTFTEIFNAIGAALGPTGLLNIAIASVASVLVSGTIWADTALIKKSLINIRDTIAEFDKVGQTINNMQGLASISDDKRQALQDSVNSIIDIYNILSGKNGGPKDRGVVQQGIPWVTSAKTNSLKNILSAFSNMEQITSQVNKLGSITIVDGAAEQVKKLSETIDEIIRAMPNMAQYGMIGPKNLVTNTKHLANALYQMRRMAFSINKLAGLDVNTSGFSGFIGQLKTALASLDDVSGDLELDITVKLKSGFQESVNAVIKKIKDAKSSIKAQTAGVSFTIPVTVRFSLTTNFGLVLARLISQRNRLSGAGRTPISGGTTLRATGGMIYRAGGGGVPFKRRGTDTVPAMLTPGEYVQRKQAVSYFGIDFMRKVNNLDVKGAMSDLMRRAGGMANVGRGTTITNNYNNNQKVVQNINTNSPDFAFRSASRFVGAF